MADQHLPKPWWRRLRISVRTLMIMVAILVVGLGWIVRCAQVQHDAVTAIQGVEGRVWCVWQLKQNHYISEGEPWSPRWVVNRVGVD